MALALALFNRGWVAVLCGDLDLALRHSEEAVRLTESEPEHVAAAWAGSLYAGAMSEAGSARRARDTLLEAGGGPLLERLPGPFRAHFLEILANCHLALDEQDEAEAAAVHAHEHAERFAGLRLTRAAAIRAVASVELARGDAAAAAEHALEAAEHADAIGARVVASVARMLAARALVAAGDKDRAAAELERAAATLEACGARRYRDRAERDLRKLGRAVHRRTERGRPDGDGLAALTGRELEIARLVVDRRTNPEIASELFLSVKTVETHMSNIFRKLGASSRVEVARIVERAPSLEGA
jgi:DNA-binding NarL/FixJ family response regulator